MDVHERKAVRFREAYHLGKHVSKVFFHLKRLRCFNIPCCAWCDVFFPGAHGWIDVEHRDTSLESWDGGHHEGQGWRVDHGGPGGHFYRNMKKVVDGGWCRSHPQPPQQKGCWHGLNSQNLKETTIIYTPEKLTNIPWKSMVGSDVFPTEIFPF